MLGAAPWECASRRNPAGLFPGRLLRKSPRRPRAFRSVHEMTMSLMTRAPANLSHLAFSGRAFSGLQSG